MAEGEGEGEEDMLVFFLVALGASVVGAICGIGGGVIIKPVLDLMKLETVSAISFLSSCTVLTMSCYSVGRSMLGGERRVAVRTGTPMAIGAAAGGLLGSRLFSLIRDMSTNPNGAQCFIAKRRHSGLHKRSAHYTINIIDVVRAHGIELILMSRMERVIFANERTIIHNKYFTFIRIKSIILSSEITRFYFTI